MENEITWGELGDFLEEHPEAPPRSNPVLVYNYEDGSISKCELFFISDNNEKEKLVLIINDKEATH
jgi:hypothetical protein